MSQQNDEMRPNLIWGKFPNFTLKVQYVPTIWWDIVKVLNVSTKWWDKAKVLYVSTKWWDEKDWKKVSKFDHLSQVCPNNMMRHSKSFKCINKMMRQSKSFICINKDMRQILIGKRFQNFILKVQYVPIIWWDKAKCLNVSTK